MAKSKAENSKIPTNSEEVKTSASKANGSKANGSKANGSKSARKESVVQRIRKRTSGLLQKSSATSVLSGWLGVQKVNGACPIEVTEAESDLVVRAEVPGYASENLKIHVEPRLLSISGVHEEKETNGESTIYSERHGTFQRKVDLPISVDPDASRAELRSGVLEIVMRKRDARTLQINEVS